jgi:hypothetical protein
MAIQGSAIQVAEVLKNMTMDNTDNKIAEVTGRAPSECSCTTCQFQCKRTPCLGTPQDIERLLDAGYGDRLSATIWAAGMMMGIVNFPLPMIQAKREEGGCTFFKDGLCELHDKGLKPTEGRLSHHSITEENFSRTKNLTWNIAKEWLKIENEAVIGRIIDKYKAVIGPKADMIGEAIDKCKSSQADLP